MIQVTDILYKQLFKVALHTCYGKEDNAAICTNQVLLNLHTYKAGDSEAEFWAWARRIIKNKKNELYHKQKKDLHSFCEEKFFVEVEDEAAEDSVYFEKLKDNLTPDELSWCLNYMSSKETKSGADKTRFLRLKKKVKDADTASTTHYYLLVDTFTGQEKRFSSKAAIASLLNCTRSHINDYTRREVLIKQRYLIFKKPLAF